MDGCIPREVSLARGQGSRTLNIDSSCSLVFRTPAPMFSTSSRCQFELSCPAPPPPICGIWAVRVGTSLLWCFEGNQPENHCSIGLQVQQDISSFCILRGVVSMLPTLLGIFSLVLVCPSAGCPRAPRAPRAPALTGAQSAPKKILCGYPWAFCVFCFQCFFVGFLFFFFLLVSFCFPNGKPGKVILV